MFHSRPLTLRPRPVTMQTDRQSKCVRFTAPSVAGSAVSLFAKGKTVATKPTNSDVEFLRAYLQKLRTYEKVLRDLSPEDLQPANDGLPETSEDEERCARLADKHGCDGNLFRNLFALHPECDGAEFDLYVRRIRRRIETIPRIIAAIESTDAGQETPPADTTTPQWTVPMTKTLIGEIFTHHRNHVDKLVLDRYEHRQDGRRIRMLVKDMPAGYEQIVESQKRRKRKQDKNSQ